MPTPDVDMTDPGEETSSPPTENSNGVNVDAADGDGDSGPTSALQENLIKKGKNAYYFAHAHKANGPEWDGKAEPKLLSKSSIAQSTRSTSSISTFDMSKSNIKSYAFADEGTRVKLYISLEGVGEKCADEDISLDFTEQSFCLIVRNYGNDENDDKPLCLSFDKLTAKITNATCKKKKDRIILSLTKESEGEWHTINDKGAPSHELV